jgi:hypothetical protein
METKANNSKVNKHIKLLEGLDNQEKVVMATGLVNGHIITLYGEVHSDINNQFYEQLDIENHHVMVEHSTMLCALKPHEHVLFKKAKGSDWIWFTRTVANLPVTCIDSRLAHGFLNSMEEAQIRGMSYTDPNLGVMTLRVLRAANKIKANFEPIIEIYDDLFVAIKRQYKIIGLVNINALTKSTVVLKDKSIPLMQLAENVKNILVTNLIKLASLSVDMNVLNILEQSDQSLKQMSAFMGINHVLRLANIIGLAVVTTHPNIDKFIESAYMFSEGNSDVEDEILKQLA